jgi:hypothetical protein
VPWFRWLQLSFTCALRLVSGPWVANFYLNLPRLAWTPFYSFINFNFSKLTSILFSTLSQINSLYIQLTHQFTSISVALPQRIHLTIQFDLWSTNWISLFRSILGTSSILPSVHLIFSIDLVASLIPLPNRCYSFRSPLVMVRRQGRRKARTVLGSGNGEKKKEGESSSSCVDASSAREPKRRRREEQRDNS